MPTQPSTKSNMLSKVTLKSTTRGAYLIIAAVSFVSIACPFLFGYGILPLTNFAGEIVSVSGFGALLLVATRYGAFVEISRELKSLWLAMFMLLLLLLGQHVVFRQTDTMMWVTVAGYLIAAAAAVWAGSLARGGQFATVWCNGMATGVLTGAVLASLASAAQYMKFDASWLILSPVVDSGRTFGFVRQPNHQATFLCLGLGALFCIQAQVSRRVGFILFLILAPILIFGIVSTGSRSGSLQLASILVAAFVFCRKNQCGSWKVPFALSVAVLIWGALYVLAEYDVLEFYGASKIAQTRTEGIGIRHEIWRSTLNLIFERPWFGWGISSYASIFLLSGAAEKVGVMMTHSHNLFLQLAFSFGIPTAVLFCALMALVLWKVRTQIFTPLGFFGFIVLACLFIHSQIEFPLWYAYFLLPAAYVLGWLAQSTNGHSILHVEKSPAQNPKVSRSRPKFHKSIAAGLGLALIGTSVWINNDYYRITPIFARGLKVNLEERLAVANSVTWLGQYPAFLTLLRTKVDPLNYKAYLESASKLGCQFHDIWYQPPTILALTYAGETDDAKWILYSFWRISGGNTSYFKPSLAESGTPEALDILAFVEDPQPVPKSIITFDAACYDR